MKDHEFTSFMYIAAILNLFQIVPLGSIKTCTYITLSRTVYVKIFMNRHNHQGFNSVDLLSCVVIKHEETRSSIILTLVESRIPRK